MLTTTPRARSAQRGAGLLLAVYVMLAAIALTVVIVAVRESTVAVSTTVSFTNSHKALRVAEAGLEYAITDLRQRVETAPLDDPFAMVDSVHNTSPFGTLQLTNGTNVVGEYVISYQVLGLGPTTDDQRDASHRYKSRGRARGTGESLAESATASSTTQRSVFVTVTAYYPDRDTPEAYRITKTMETAVELNVQAASTFSYGYFIDNWGLLYDNTIVVNGNVRANGPIDFGDTTATVNAEPQFSVSTGTLDTQTSVGGVYSGWSILNADNAGGEASQADYQHANQPAINMANLTDLTLYEALATTDGSTIVVAGTTYVSGVLGDGGGEDQHLYLEGTADDPIELNGTVVVRGSVIIKGKVSGQGAIYAGGNIYIADDLEYVDPPATNRPSATDKTTMQAWITANAGKDMLGLFAKDHVVIGDYSNSTFQTYVGNWLNNAANESAEDLGADGLPNTANGRDGVVSTADDDTLETDSTFSISTYSATDGTLGRIPAGSNVGDNIPGTGEDRNGNGVYDGRIALADFNLPATLDSGAWAGNVPDGASAISDVASVYISEVEAAVYTNNAVAGVMVSSSDPINFNGAVVARVEAISASAPQVNFNHDSRLLVNETGSNGIYLPRSLGAVTTLYSMEQTTGPDASAPPVEEESDTYTIVLTVTNNGVKAKANKELSHYSIEATPGTYSNFSFDGVPGVADLGPNLGTDPFDGFKVDECSGIGGGEAGSFTVTYTLEGGLQTQQTSAKAGQYANIVSFAASDFQYVLDNPGSPVTKANGGDFYTTITSVTEH